MAQPDTQGQQNDAGTSGHPAWQEVLDTIPEEHRETLAPILTPALEKWDKSVEERFSQLHSDYAPFDPIIKEHSAEDIQAAIGVTDFLMNNPQEALERLAEMVGVDLGQGQAGEGQSNLQNNGDGENDDDPYDERFSSIEEALGMIAETLVGNQQSQQEREGEVQLQQVLDQLQSKYKVQFDEEAEDYIVHLIGKEITPDKAVEQYFRLTGKNPQAENVPPVIGSGGGLPTNQKDISKLTPEQIEELTVATLRAANQQGG